MTKDKIMETLAVLAKDFNSKRRLDGKNMCKVLLEMSLAIEKGSRVIDLGCGSGRFLIPLARLYPENMFTGWDISREMLQELDSGVDKIALKNVNSKLFNFNKRDWNGSGNGKYDTALVFQAIHFVNDFNSFFENLASKMSERSRVIVASTTHEQFYKLPYCKAFPGALKMELDRTPDEPAIIQHLKRVGYEVQSKININIRRKFEDRAAVESWLKQRPFSVLTYLDDQAFEEGVVKFLKGYRGGEIEIDRFAMLTFSKER